MKAVRQIAGTLSIALALALASCSSHDIRRQASSARLPAHRSPRWTIPKEPLRVIPRPREIVRAAGDFTLPRSTSIGARAGGARDVAGFLVAELRRYGTRTSFDDRLSTATIRLALDGRPAAFGAEGYRLDVAGSGISIQAATAAGLFYGVQTLTQLLWTNGRSAHAIPCVHIVDRPQYRWRGVHLDVSRHFFTVAVVERYIDLASRFKLNTFHWHLTDDQGWRIEVRAYPRLTAVGGCRDGTQIGGFGSGAIDRRHACGFYSQKQIRAVVAYAKARYVTVIPEIEGPGHSLEALAAYPFLACTPGAFATLQRWGSSTYNVCPTERVFQFYDDVFREISALFPAPFIHVGGDEVPYASWRESPFVATLMQREHLQSYAAVQNYFTRRLETIAHAYRRRIVGWDEIDAAGVRGDAVVMAWNGEQHALAAARHGHDVVMSPGPPLYFDAYQGDPRLEPPAFPGSQTTLEMVYAYDPSATTPGPVLRSRIIGAQGNLWTEYVPNARHLWYMAYPRTLALAELCWTPRSRMRWADFTVRLGPSLSRLESESIPFRIPEIRYRVAAPAVPHAVPQTTIALTALVPGAAIHYTLDGTPPTPFSATYGGPLHIAPGLSGTRISAIAVLGDKRMSAPSFLDLARR